MTIKMKVPATNAPNQIFYPDGTAAVVDAFGYLDVPNAFVNAMLGVGFTEVTPLRNDCLPLALRTAMTDTTAAAITAASLIAADVTIDMTGTLGAGAALTLPTVAALIAAMPEATIGQIIKLRIINSGAGAFAWTLTTATTWTLTGTMTVAQNTFRDFYMTITGATTGTVVQRGTGTNS